MASYRSAIWFACGCLACGGPAWALPAQADSAPRCRVDVLAALGWRFEPAAVEHPLIDAGTPCRRADLRAAQRAGDLRVVLPEGSDPAADPALLDAVLADPATRCAYLFRLGAAARRAIDRLVANPGYRFTALQAGWIGFGFGGPTVDGWQPIASFGRGFQPVDSNWRAIDGFYRGRVRSECGVGRQIAQYATQAELYGAAAFDREFANDEIVIGTFNRLQQTRSILLGTQAGSLLADGHARQASRLGRQAFAGLPGFVLHRFDRSHLDDINNQAQNFVVYAVDADAADALRRHGGFADYNRQALRLWQQATTLERHGRRYFERLLVDREPALRARLDDRQRATVAELDRLLGDPFFAGFLVYVHHHGVQPVGYHLVRMLDRNPRTPYVIELAMHNLHTTLYRRYIEHLLQQCRRARNEIRLPG